jgi:hypothetical protein
MYRLYTVSDTPETIWASDDRSRDPLVAETKTVMAFPGSVAGQQRLQDLPELPERVEPQLPPLDLLVEGVILLLGPPPCEFRHFRYIADLSRRVGRIKCVSSGFNSDCVTPPLHLRNFRHGDSSLHAPKIKRLPVACPSAGHLYTRV